VVEQDTVEVGRVDMSQMTLQSLTVAGAEQDNDEVDGFEDDWLRD
jgi:hypothetical protein